MNTLEELIDAGKTPESIYQDCLDIIKERNAKKAREEQKQEDISLATDQVLQALEGLFKANGLTFDDSDARVAKKMLKDLVEAARIMKPIQEKAKKMAEMDKTDNLDEVEEFLKSIEKVLGAN